MAEQRRGDAEEAKRETEVSPEVRERFEREKRTGAFRAFNYGRENSIPQEELAAFIRATATEKRANGEYQAAARLLQTTGVGTPEEILVAAEAPARETNVEVPAIDDLESEEEEMNDLVLHPDATFADFMDTLERSGEAFRDAFDAELEDILGTEEAELVRDLMESRSSAEYVRDVLARCGISEGEAEHYFFIRFSK